MTWPILSDSADLAVELARLSQVLDLAVQPRVESDWLQAAGTCIEGGHLAIAVLRPPGLDALVHLAQHAAQRGHTLLFATLGGKRADRRLIEATCDLGIFATGELRPLAALLALHQAGAERPWAAQRKTLAAADRVRLKESADSTDASAGEIVRADDGLLAWRAGHRAKAHKLGEAPDVHEALATWRRTSAHAGRMVSKVEGADHQAVLDIIVGPRRALSDPASKTALLAYGVPLPVEELCASASRAAAEASRIGFPVRLTLTSPDLRIWDHPDLSVDRVENAAAVREVYRSLTLLAQTRLPTARLLGVTVTATSQSQALLHASLRPLTEDTVEVCLGFADAHGAASDDTTWLVLPGPPERVERAIERLNGSSLVLPAQVAQRRRHLESLGDVLHRLAAFVQDHRHALESVELRPLALLLDGSVEVREACVTVGDAFERTLAGSLPPP